MNRGFRIALLVLIPGLLVALLWNQIPAIKQLIHLVLDPTAGILLTWNVTLGIIIVTGVISLILTLVQKYTVDQEEMRRLKKEQKDIQEEMKKFRDHPEKMMELNKKQMALLPETMDLSMRPMIYTSLPIILFFRWFNDFFITAGNPKILGFMSWFWAYLIFSIIFSLIYRKLFKVA